jgi:plastocyanin
MPRAIPFRRLSLLCGPLLGLLLLGLVPLLAGCDDPKKTALTPLVVQNPGTAKIIGKIQFAGSPPAIPPIDVSSVADCAKLHPQGITNESIVVDKDGNLQNAIVYLKNIKAPAGGSSPSPVILDQLGCQYRPHVIAVQAGQIVRVQSHDPFMHNVRTSSTQNDVINFAELASAGTTASRDLTFASPEFFSFHCDVHPWMQAWVGVFDHPWFAVSDATGSFEIDNVPAGTFTLAVWQERLGELTQQITITDGKTQSVTFTYSR